jgi:hypothetical protein
MTAHESGIAQQARHPFATTADGRRAQRGVDARRSIRPATGGVQRANLDTERLIGPRAGGRRSPAPRIEPTARNAEHATECRHRMIRLLHFDEHERR